MKYTFIFSILLALALSLTACGAENITSAPETEPTTQIFVSTIPALTDTPAVLPTDTSAPQPTDPPAATEPSTVTVSFANDILPIFDSRCINCHGGDKTNEGLDMKTYESLMAGSKNGSVLTPGSANDSLLVKQLLEGKMPKRGPKLTPVEVQTIIDWINAGALNN